MASHVTTLCPRLHPFLLTTLMSLTTVVIAQYGAQPPLSLDLKHIQQLTYGLEHGLFILGGDASNSATLSAAIDEKVKAIIGKKLPLIDLANAQQDELVREYAKQIKALEHRQADRQATTAELLSTASEVGLNLAYFVFDLKNKINETQDLYYQADNAQGNLGFVKSAYLYTLNSTCETLEAQLEETETKQLVLQTFVDKRKCEYLSGYLDADTHIPVAFKTLFAETPVVSVSVSGFQSDLDQTGYGHYDGLSLHKQVTQVTPESFTLYTKDTSEGMVQIKTVVCSVMVCQGLSEQVDLHAGVPKCDEEEEECA